MLSISSNAAELNNEPMGEKWQLKMNAAFEMGKRMLAAGCGERGANIMACGQRIDYKYCPECGQYEVINTSLCRDRMCPLCSWRLGLKRYAEMMQVMDELLPIIKKGHTVGMLTLTVRNVSLKKLSKTLDKMALAYKRMSQRVTWKKQIMGYARNLEITRNEDDGSFHPHYHILVVCHEGVEPGVAILSIAREWGEGLEADYIPICDGAEAYSNKDGKVLEGDLTGAILECSKYATKPGITKMMSDEELAAYSSILSGRQLISYGGIIAEERQKLGITDRRTDQDPAGSILKIKDKCECGADMQGIIAEWAGGSQWTRAEIE